MAPSRVITDLGDAAALKAADEVARAPGDAREQRESDR